MKRLIVSALSCLAVSCAFSQSFFNGAGVTVFVTTAQGATAQSVGALTYSPRINVMENDNFSLSLGIPVSLGASGSVNSQSGSSLSFIFNAPLLCNINFGAGSTKDNDSRFGFFAGAGAGYQYGTINVTDPYYGDVVSSNISTYGPVADAGVRIGVGEGTHNIEIRGQFMKGMDASKANSIGVGAVFNF